MRKAPDYVYDASDWVSQHKTTDCFQVNTPLMSPRAPTYTDIAVMGELKQQVLSKFKQQI